MKYVRGETVRHKWVYILDDDGAIVAIVHPEHIDKFLATGDMEEELVAILEFAVWVKKEDRNSDAVNRELARIATRIIKLKSKSEGK